jgi:hypothetical protein
LVTADAVQIFRQHAPRVFRRIALAHRSQAPALVFKPLEHRVASAFI